MKKKPLVFLKGLPNKLNRFYFKKSKSSLVINNKSKERKKFNPVTNFDRSFEKLIRSLISKSFPKESIIGEEFKDKCLFSEYKWSVDPIDGTKAFISGFPTWSNLIGLMHKEKAIIGIANFPELNRYYLNDEKKSYLYKNKKKFIIKSSNNYNLRKIKIIGNFHGNITSKEKAKLINKFGKSFNLLSFDALSYCSLAEGKVDAVIETNLKPYDIVPLISIIKHAGGCVSRWNNEPAEKGGNILATSNIKLHNRILKLLKPFTKK